MRFKALRRAYSSFKLWMEGRWLNFVGWMLDTPL